MAADKLACKPKHYQQGVHSTRIHKLQSGTHALNKQLVLPRAWKTGDVADQKLSESYTTA